MRIAHVCATFPPYCGGTGNVCYHQARELMRCGFDVQVFTRAIRGVPLHEEGEGFGIQRLHPVIDYGNSAFLPGLTSSLKSFDVIHLHYPFYGGETAALAAKLNRVPLVITYHQDVLLGGWAGLLETFLRFSLEKATLRSARRVMFTSMDYYEHSQGRELLSGQEWAVREMPNAVDVERFHPDSRKQSFLSRIEWTDDPFVVLLVAGLDRAHSFKGVEIFLSALRCLPEDVVGVVVGEGELREKYELIARHEGLERRAFFAGRVPEGELAGYYAGADVTVLPSTQRGEAFGPVLLESMACGTPVIASNLSGVRTVVEDEVDGFMVEPKQVEGLTEKVLILKQDKHLRIEMGVRGRRKVVERYAWDKVIPDLIGIYYDVVDGR